MSEFLENSFVIFLLTCTNLCRKLPPVNGFSFDFSQGVLCHNESKAFLCSPSYQCFLVWLLDFAYFLDVHMYTIVTGVYILNS